MPGYEDDRDLDTRVSQLALKVQTVYSWKPDVQDEATWPTRSLAG
jgi:hypothetical protein